MTAQKAAKRERVMIRGIDRTNDFRIICQECGRDFGGTVAPRAGYRIRFVLCPVCEFGSVENQMRIIKTRLANAGQ